MVFGEGRTERQTYQVQLPTFKGPLDLLLHLIEQQQLDITTISLAQVTDQYLAHLQRIEKVAPDELTDFITVAARLLLIKSRVLLPRPPRVIEEQEDVGEDLVWQLREYKRFKQVAQILRRRDQSGWHMYTRTVPLMNLAETRELKLDLSGTSLDDLSAALHALLREQPDTSSELNVVSDTVTIDDKIAQISELLRSQQVLTFGSLLDDAASRVEIIVTLLAILEMIRDLRVSVQQERLFGEILILAGEKHAPQDESQPTGESNSGQKAAILNA